jgi:hypothetical protein
MTVESADFDTRLFSPLARIRDLRAQALEAVVGRDLSHVQRLMYQPGRLEERLEAIIRSPGTLMLIVITGSAGGGKSAIINHLLERLPPGSCDPVIRDATHAEAPDEEQSARLARFFEPFSDGAPTPMGTPRMIAMNTGMVLKFFADVRADDHALSFAELEALLKHRLRVPQGSREANTAALDDHVLVVNLDQRPTAGEEGDVFDLILKRLDPDDPGGVLEGAQRCATCRVANWCFPMANAKLLSSTRARTALNEAAGAVALVRGRQLAPRALWDSAATLTLGGLDASTDDPCFEIAEIRDADDVQRVADGLATGNVLDTPGVGVLGEIAEADPTRWPSSEVHDLIAEATLQPGNDAGRVREWLGGTTGSQPCVEFAASRIAADRARIAGRLLARAAWLAGEIPSHVDVPAEFRSALLAQGQDAVPGDESPSGQALLSAIERVAEGLAAGFGRQCGPETFFPTDDPGGDREADLLVKADVVNDADLLWFADDPVLAADRHGATLVGYRPLSVAMVAVGVPLPVNLALWSLLDKARAGTAPRSVDVERFLGLRRAVESIGRLAAANRSLPLLVVQRATGRSFRVAPYGPTASVLRATEVV